MFASKNACTAKQCNKYWKRSANLTKHLHWLTDQELALLSASQSKGTAKDAADTLEVEKLEALVGLAHPAPSSWETCTRTL